ncbi:non-ribosomal peptide synthetase [Winogradskya humida]|uniref:Carrier domain-containing protein n=1 Tax=Winogradskya humida TaxID=113566 RepID=A0ABQ4A2A6_9ACTN|nr:non-ribosomal peptide synthetase [Actinoplanes humidus]GIE24996.1 hypothetical protein Ahu01nite_080980 [Actinoplanes humidus]
MPQGTEHLAHLTGDQRERLLRKLRAARAGTTQDRVVPVGRDAALPLSAAQQGLWLLAQVDEQATTYNTPLAMRVSGALDAGLLGAALRQVVERHEVLRTTYQDTPDGPRQRVRPQPAPGLLTVREEPGLTGAGRDAAATRIAGEQARRTFDLSRDPVLRATLVRFAPDDHLLVLALHHIATDAWSTGRLIGELTECYTAAAQGRAPRLAELAVQYADFAVWQQRRFASGATKASLAYWQEQLAGIGELDFPADRPVPAEPSGAGAVVSTLLPAELHRGAHALAAQTGTRVLSVVTAAYAAVLAAVTGKDDIALGTVFSGRLRTEIEPLIGMFAGTAVLRISTDGDPSFRELLARTGTVLSQAHAHQEVPFEQVVAELAPQRRPGRNPLFQFAVHAGDPAPAPITMGEVVLTPVPAHAGAARFDCTVAVAERPEQGGIELAAEYATELFDAGRIQRLLEHTHLLLAAALADPDAPVSTLPLLTPGELAFLDTVNNTAVDVPAPGAVELFAAQVARTPDAPAVTHRGTTLSFAELDRRANRVAHRLRELGVGAGALVGVCVHRSTDLVAAMLGVHKAGAAYVPLDPDYPAARIELVLSASAAAAVLVDERGRESLPATSAAVVDVSDLPGGAADGEPGVVPAERDLAYVIFTSGSTGTPKGVMVEHAQLRNLLVAADPMAGGRTPGTWLAVTSVSFDISVVEVFWALVRGFHVVVAEGRVDQLLGAGGDGSADEPATLRELITRHAVTHLQCTPALAELLVDDDASRAALGGVTRMIVGGEALPAPLARRLRDALAGELVNGYGPTEAAVYATAAEVSATDADGTGTVSIGGPLANTTAYVLDRWGRPQPVGVPGELYIGGAGVSRGYHAQPALTAERFVPDPFGGPGGRLYRTGDLVRLTHDGVLDFLGRTDHQVKVRGFRIELGEVETVLRAHPAVLSAVVVAGGAPASRFLAAYVAGVDGARTDATELREFCRRKLPEHMVPARWQWLEAFPLTPNGKVDRSALPELDAPVSSADSEPRTGRERELAAVWATALGLPVEIIGVHDNFFALGGHSVTVTRAVSIAAARGVPLTVRELFTHQSIAELARAGAPAGPVLPAGVVAISPAGSLAPLFCLHSSTGTALPYLPLDGTLHPDRPCYAIEADPVVATIDELTDRAVTLITTVRPAGPYHLAGWSLGGGLAWSVAARLQALGHDVASLTLLDTHPPVVQEQPPSHADGVRSFAHTVARSPMPLDLPADASDEDQLAVAVTALQDAGLVRPGDRADVLGRGRLFIALMAAASTWRPEPYKGAVDLVVAADPGNVRELVDGWTGWTDGPLRTRVVPGDHFSMVDEVHAAGLGRVLEGIMTFPDVHK